MNIEKSQNVTFLTFNIFKNQPGLKHGFSTKLGGVSTGVFESMNLGFNRGDSDENVQKNYELMANALHMDKNRMCLSKQTHTTNIRVITEEDAGNGIVRPIPYDDVDGLITNVKNLPLVTFYADCVPLFLYDPTKQVIALSHSGWRGTVGKIGKLTVEKMNTEFGCNPADILCAIGPSICKDCYEVSEDVIDEFKKAFGKDAQRLFSKSVFNPNDNSKYMLNLWEACRLVFLEAGIDNPHIEVTDYCTRCHPELFYSHRIMGVNRGSLAAFMSL